jgi:hypothetical protein
MGDDPHRFLFSINFLNPSPPRSSSSAIRSTLTSATMTSMISLKMPSLSALDLVHSEIEGRLPTGP